MGLKECASWESVCRGYDAYKENKVQEIKQESEKTLTAVVKGSGKTKYHVYIDVEHPRKSKCDCPHANGRRVVCEHQMATFFKAFPQEVEILEQEFAMAEQYDDLNEQKEIAMKHYLDGLSKDELKSVIYFLLDMSPEWISDILLEDDVGFDEDEEKDDEDFEEIVSFGKGKLKQEKQKKNDKKATKSSNTYVLTMRLRDTDIWRKIAIKGTCSFADLHTVIQIAFGWENCHLHHFEVGKMVIGNYNDEEMELGFDMPTFKFEDDVNLELILLNCEKFVYCYDFGDDWHVDIQVENTPTAQIEETPVILEFGGGMAKEDCGGASALMEMRRRKTNLSKLNLILKDTFDI